MQDEEVLGKAYDARLMQRLVQYLRPHKASVAAALVLILFDSALESLFPWLTKIAIDNYISQNTVNGLGVIALGYLAVLIVKFFAGAVQARVLQRSEVLRNRRLRDAEFGLDDSADVSGGCLTVGDQLEDATPDRIPEDIERVHVAMIALPLI